MKYLFIGLIIVLSGIGVYAAYMGAFISIKIEEKNMGPYHFVYKEIVGTDFKEVSRITTEINSFLTENSISQAKPLDIYYPKDHPNEIGFLIEIDQMPKFAKPDTSIKYKLVPEQKCMVTEFPFRNPSSFFVGYFKVDAALTKFRDERQYKKTEAATINEGDRIIYFQPIAKAN